MGKDLGSLKHIRKKTLYNGNVLILDKGETITSEDEAMLQALHSRSTKGVEKHLETLERKGSGSFMERYFVGYGHKSIGDCGSTTIFVEDISMLTAKALQDNPLFSGQESSTRYVNFSDRNCINPLGTKEGENILESEKEFYLSLLDPLKEFLKEQNPLKKGEDEIIYKKAIDARAYDIARSFLPAGIKTNMAWHSNLRQISDKLIFLRNHPLGEVRETANTIEDAVKSAHPHSFRDHEYSKTEEYQKLIAEDYYYHDPDSPKFEIGLKLDKEEFERHRKLFKIRPPHTELPRIVNQSGRITSRFILDFSSFRDLSRHRAINQRMPLLTTELGFEDWYLENLPENQKKKAEGFLSEIEKRIRSLDLPPEEKQYYTPMGFRVSNRIEGDIPSMVYMAELRSTRQVHPTLRPVARKIGEYVKNTLNISVYIDKTPDRFDTKRGKQDIVEKE